VLSRNVTPPELGDAVLTFDATLAGEARDALERLSAPIARFLQACVPADVDGLRVESAWAVNRGRVAHTAEAQAER
jgi:hypothetical protein